MIFAIPKIYKLGGPPIIRCGLIMGGGREKCQIFGMAKITLVCYIRPNLMTHMSYDQFWAFIYQLGHSIVIILEPQFNNERRTF